MAVHGLSVDNYFVSTNEHCNIRMFEQGANIRMFKQMNFPNLKQIFFGAPKIHKRRTLGEVLTSPSISESDRAILRAIDPTVVMFEAPTKDLQVEMIRTVGPAVNLGNVAAADVIGVETLRRGLRGDTLLDLTTVAVPVSLHPFRHAQSAA